MAATAATAAGGGTTAALAPSVPDTLATGPVSMVKSEDGWIGAAPSKRNVAAATASSKKERGGGAPRGRAAGASFSVGGGALMAAPKLKHLVIDTGAIIRGVRLDQRADNYWTVPGVMNEVRDKRARAILEALPFEVRVRTPSEEAIRFVVDFAKKTGDMRELSRVDTQILALTYELEKEVSGAMHLRAEPLRFGGSVVRKDGPDAAGAGGAARLSTVVADGETLPAEAEMVTDSDSDDDGGVEGERDEGDKGGESAAEAASADAATTAPAATAAVPTPAPAAAPAPPAARGTAVRFAEPEPAATEAFPSLGADAFPALGATDDAFPALGASSATAGASGAAAATESNAAIEAGAAATTAGGAVRPPKPAFSWASVAATEADPDADKKSAGPRVVADMPTAAEAEAVAAAAAAEADAGRDASDDATGGGDDATMGEAGNGGAAVLATAAPGRGMYSSRILGGGAKPSAMSKDAMAAAAAEDDGAGWIGPGNVTSGGVTGGPWGTRTRAARDAREVVVGCVTTDYAMQNVLLQVGLSLLSVDGRSIDKVKHWVLKCDACYKITTDMTKLFCPSCGNAALARLGVTIGRNGKPRYHYKKNRTVRTTGSRYTLPAARGGREADLLLREDQLLTGQWKQRAHKKESVKSMFGDPLGLEEAGKGRSTVGQDVVVGFGRRNPNAMKGRERRGQKKKKRPQRR